MDNNKTAVVLGATGLVGSNIINLLLTHDSFSQVKILVRKPANYNHKKITEHIVNFDHIDNYAHLITGDVIFSAFGTTIKKAGSKQNQYKIDYTYQYNILQAAANNKIPTCVLVSSAGANARSKIFYSRIKGQLETDVKKLGFSKLVILQPSVLDGKRAETRFAESFAITLGKVLNIIPFARQYRPIKASIVAKAMINATLNNNAMPVYTLNKIFGLAKNN